MVQSPNMPPVSAVVEGEITGIQRARTNANEELDVSVQFPWNYQHPTHLYVRMGAFDGLDLTTAYGTYKFQVRRGNPHKGKEGSSTLWDYRFDLEVFNPDLPVTPSQSEYGNYTDVFLENVPMVISAVDTQKPIASATSIVMPEKDENGDVIDPFVLIDPTYAEKDEVQITPEDTRKPSQGGPSPMYWSDARGEDAGKTPTMDYRSAVIQWQNARTTAIAMISAQPELYGKHFEGQFQKFLDTKEYEEKVMEVAKRCFTELWPEWLAPRIQRARK